MPRVSGLPLLLVLNFNLLVDDDGVDDDGIDNVCAYLGISGKLAFSFCDGNRMTLRP